MRIQDVTDQMRVLVARPLTADICSDVGRMGTVVSLSRRWVEVVLDGESSRVPFRASELEPVRFSKATPLEPLRSSLSHETDQTHTDPRVETSDVLESI
jgi:hypothetical protein